MAATGDGMNAAGAEPRPTTGRRLAAAAALACLVAALVVLVVEAVRQWDVLLLSVAALAAAVAAGWVVLSRRGTARLVAVFVLAAALAVFASVVLASESLRVGVVVLALAAVSVAAAKRALGVHARGEVPVADDRPAAPRPRKPVLVMNLRSGGGKAQRFDLVGHCRDRGVEAVVLGPDDDLRALVEDAVARGADVIGMAGGDGSQALVASVASRHGVPLVVVPAGTRNHFALDLGLDREDVPGALDAYSDGVDVVIDLAEVNGRPFVNNASMGVYAKVVQSPEYRDAKVRTAAELLPDILGPDATPPDLRFALPSGEQMTTAHMLLVSNNRYQMSEPHPAGRMREQLDGGELGVVALSVRGAGDAQLLAAAQAAGQLRRFPGWHEWTTTTLEVGSGGPVEIGVDGEALVLDPPLRFAIRPGALTVRLPRSAVARRIAPAIRVGSTETLAALWRTALGRPAAG